MPASRIVLEVSKGRYLPAVLRERSFALLFAGQSASSIGTWMSVVAVGMARMGPLGAALGVRATMLGASAGLRGHARGS